MRSLSLMKNSQRYVFRYTPGSECDLLEAVAELAADPDSDFDWVDAASISFQVTCEQATSCLDAIEPHRKTA